MTHTKIHIDLQRGVVEAEGELAFVKTVYEDFKAQLTQPKATYGGHKSAGPVAQVKAKPKGNGTNKAKGKGKANGKLDKTLDLAGSGKVPSLKAYLGGFNATSNMEKNVVFVSYLKDELDMASVNIDHIYTCHNAVGKIPKALDQSLRDTSNKGFINYSGDDPDITLAVPGINWLKANPKTPEAAAA